MTILEFFQHIAYCSEGEKPFCSEKSAQESKKFFATEFKHFGNCTKDCCTCNACLQDYLKVEAGEMLQAYIYFAKEIKQ